MIGFKTKLLFAACLLLCIFGASWWAKVTFAKPNTEELAVGTPDWYKNDVLLFSKTSPNFESTNTISQTLYIPVVRRWLKPVPSWLIYLNQFRNQANVPNLAENDSWLNGAVLHSRYMVKNDHITHSENPGNGWYTDEGYMAGKNGNIFVSSSPSISDETAIDYWMTGPFHAISMLDPQLQLTTLGSYREGDGGWQMGATLDVLRGRQTIPQGTKFPLPFPRDGGQTWLLRYTGNEWPDPLTSCPGYSAPTGSPIMLQVGEGSLTPVVTSYSLSSAGSTLPVCLFDETSYINPDGGTQSTGRSVLNSRDAIIIIPKDPLQSGQVYNVSVTANGSTTAWSFTTINSPSPTSPDERLTFEMR